MKKLSLLLILSIAVLSCSKEDHLQDTEPLNVMDNKIIIVPSDCDGYDIFPNKQYDCGWKKGYDDWVYHYNSVVNGGLYPQCYNIRVDLYTSSQTGETETRTIWQTTDNSPAIIQATKNQYQEYYENLSSHALDSDFDHGWFDGYANARGQVPFAPNGDIGDCD